MLPENRKKKTTERKKSPRTGRPGKEAARALYVAQVLNKYTNDSKALTAPEIAKLVYEESKGEVEATSKSVKASIEAIIAGDFLKITKEVKGLTPYYNVESRSLNLAESTFIYSAIQDSRFISKSLSKDLMNRLAPQISNDELKIVRKVTQPPTATKTSSGKVFINMDKIIEAVQKKCRLNFRYKIFDPDSGNYEFSHAGKIYNVTPLAIAYCESDCYMIVWRDEYESFSAFFVDRMHDVKVREDLPGSKNPRARNFKQKDFNAQVFGMWPSDEGPVVVKFRIGQDAINAFLERFNVNVRDLPKFKNGFTVYPVKVQLSPPFFAWISRFGDQLQIAGPTRVKEEYKAFLHKALDVMEREDFYAN